MDRVLYQTMLNELDASIKENNDDLRETMFHFDLLLKTLRTMDPESAEYAKTKIVISYHEYHINNLRDTGDKLVLAKTNWTKVFNEKDKRKAARMMEKFLESYPELL